MIYDIATDNARRFLLSDRAKTYGWKDEEFINGYSRIKTVKVTVMYNDSVTSIWYFETARETFGKIGYIVHSWRNQINVQVSKEDGNKAYAMIMREAKEIKGCKVIVETY